MGYCWVGAEDGTKIEVLHGEMLRVAELGLWVDIGDED